MPVLCKACSVNVTCLQYRQNVAPLPICIVCIALIYRCMRGVNCGGCDMRLARRIGAELAITGTVQKVSNLILNMNIYALRQEQPLQP